MWQFELKNGVVDVWGAVDVGKISPNAAFRSHRRQQTEVLQKLLAQAEELGQTVVATVNWGWFEPGLFYVSPVGDWLQIETPRLEKFRAVRGVL